MAYLVFAIPTAWLIDRHGIRWPTGLGVLLMLASNLMRCFANDASLTSQILVHLSFVLNGIVGPVSSSMASKLAMEWYLFEFISTPPRQSPSNDMCMHSLSIYPSASTASFPKLSSTQVCSAGKNHRHGDIRPWKHCGQCFCLRCGPLCMSRHTGFARGSSSSRPIAPQPWYARSDFLFRVDAVFAVMLVYIYI